MIMTIATEPMSMNLPHYFKKNSRAQIIENTSLGFDIYSSEKPVISESSKT
jgi:hypothetical protein